MIYLFLLAHLVADFMLQPYWLVVRKRRWDGLLIHGSLVLACMLLLSLIEPTSLALWPVMLGITAVHVAADWWKVHRADRVLRPAILPFLLDQMIHFSTIAVALSLVLPSEQVWGVATSSAGWTAIYASAYIVAALAVPIGVMIWLDPTFSQNKLAPKARLRSFIAGAAAISLALFSGALALPAALLGFVVVSRHPASSHPLDTPVGLITVLLIAVSLGATLVLIGV
jgi:hypothetical protein